LNKAFSKLSDRHFLDSLCEHVLQIGFNPSGVETLFVNDETGNTPLQPEHFFVASLANTGGRNLLRTLCLSFRFNCWDLSHVLHQLASPQALILFLLNSPTGLLSLQCEQTLDPFVGTERFLVAFRSAKSFMRSLWHGMHCQFS